jgi:hypothetical protein
MELKITDPKDDYILNSIKEQLNFSNKDYQDNRSSSQNNRQKPTNALNKTNFK